ncbi:retron St85 family RNA-directed DNA polymerase [Alishewanella sp. 16-MA]|uniref:RNA-directed DNA polymerase n=1 Tax=Alishewanella maricola TaxID=2795740 RepID=A0ABS8C7R7_9ALTE|nr:retron St85 family RNA-directed DNA polymerase [Alishewanella maricola]MCB5228384.1 retron St85 family RNA-directed DNA polymerase [Alishewanella maricola]
MNILNSVSKESGLSVTDLLAFSKTCPHRYKVYFIAKRNSDAKRVIAQPSKEVKYLQGAVIKIFKSFDLVHEAAFAYKDGINIKQNAQVHANQKYILKMDFKDFFPSITPDLLFSQLNIAKVFLSEKDKEFLSGLLFWKRRRNSKLRLSIGAPSSPLMSNIVMYFFDSYIESYCRLNRIRYTRYADDLCFSSSMAGGLDSVKDTVNKALRSFFGRKIRLNTAKTIFASKAMNRHITGITLTNDGKLSVGRDRKREIIAAVHKVSQGNSPDCSLKTLAGLISYVHSVEGDFKDRLIKKYGEVIVQKIFDSLRE